MRALDAFGGTEELAAHPDNATLIVSSVTTSRPLPRLTVRPRGSAADGGGTLEVAPPCWRSRPWRSRRLSGRVWMICGLWVMRLRTAETAAGLVYVEEC